MCAWLIVRNIYNSSTYHRRKILTCDREMIFTATVWQRHDQDWRGDRVLSIRIQKLSARVPNGRLNRSQKSSQSTKKNQDDVHVFNDRPCIRILFQLARQSLKRFTGENSCSGTVIIVRHLSECFIIRNIRLNWVHVTSICSREPCGSKRQRRVYQMYLWNRGLRITSFVYTKRLLYCIYVMILITTIDLMRQ